MLHGAWWCCVMIVAVWNLKISFFFLFVPSTIFSRADFLQSREQIYDKSSKGKIMTVWCSRNGDPRIGRTEKIENRRKKKKKKKRPKTLAAKEPAKEVIIRVFPDWVDSTLGQFFSIKNNYGEKPDRNLINHRKPDWGLNALKDWQDTPTEMTSYL